MVFREKRTVAASRDQVWTVFTNVDTWEEWYGGAMKSIEPGWENGAVVNWSVGGPSSLFDVDAPRRVGIRSSGFMMTWYFAAEGQATVVELVKDFNVGTTVVSDPAMQRRQCAEEVDGLKRYVERAQSAAVPPAPATPPSAAAAKPVSAADVLLQGKVDSWRRAISEELLRFLSSRETLAYQDKNDTWWTGYDLSLMLAKKHFDRDLGHIDFLRHVMYTVLEELQRDKKIVYTAKGYRLFVPEKRWWEFWR